MGLVAWWGLAKPPGPPSSPLPSCTPTGSLLRPTRRRRRRGPAGTPAGDGSRSAPVGVDAVQGEQVAEVLERCQGGPGLTAGRRGRTGDAVASIGRMGPVGCGPGCPLGRGAGGAHPGRPPTPSPVEPAAAATAVIVLVFGLVRQRGGRGRGAPRRPGAVVVVAVVAVLVCAAHGRQPEHHGLLGRPALRAPPVWGRSWRWGLGGLGGLGDGLEDHDDAGLAEPRGRALGPQAARTTDAGVRLLAPTPSTRLKSSRGAGGRGPRAGAATPTLPRALPLA